MKQRSVLILSLMITGTGISPAQSGGDRLVHIQHGTLPIIISAPHGGRLAVPDVPERKGQNVSRFTTVQDANTDLLAERVANLLGSELGGTVHLVIARFHRAYIDANRAPVEAFESLDAEPYYEAFHEALRGACRDVRRNWGHGILVDIHGQRAEKLTVFRGTGNGRTVQELVERWGEGAFAGPGSLCGELEARGMTVIPPVGAIEPEDSRFDGGFIVQTYGSHNETGIDAIQLEFGTKFRSDERLDRTAVQVAGAIAAFARRYLMNVQEESLGD